MINNNTLNQLKQSMNEDNLLENCDTVVEFFQLATPSDYATFINKGGDNLFESIRSHAMVLKIDRDAYLDELKKNPKSYNKFVNEMAKSSDLILTNFHF